MPRSAFLRAVVEGQPVLWQAGSSNQGRDFAAKHAEAIFAVHPNVDRMKQYANDLNGRMEKNSIVSRDRSS